MRSRPSWARPMSADVPPTSSVITLSKPACRPAQMPPTTPATGPDMSSVTGRLIAASAVATPDAEVIRCSPVRTPSASSSSWRRADVRGDLRADVGVEADRREALVLAVLRDHLATRRRRTPRGTPRARSRRRAARGRVEEREQEADADGLDSGVFEVAHLLARLLLVERHEHGAVSRRSARAPSRRWRRRTTG